MLITNPTSFVQCFLGVTSSLGCESHSVTNPYHWFCSPVSSFEPAYLFMKTWVGSCFEEHPQRKFYSSNPFCLQSHSYIICTSLNLQGSTDTPRIQEELWYLTYKGHNSIWEGNWMSTFQMGTTWILIAASLEAMLECYNIVNSASEIEILYNQLLFPLKKA